MKIFAPNEMETGERRAALTPATVSKLRAAGWEIFAEPGFGSAANCSAEDFEAAGLQWLDRSEGLATADLVLRIGPPGPDEIDALRPNSIHISFLRPFANGELLRRFVDRGIRAISLELIPRITQAQSMDALTSQSNLAGYAAALRGAQEIPILTPMMVTAAGTISPARFLILGAGVAGLQAIATAKRLGATIEAYDARPTVEEQVRSLGAKFLTFDLAGAEETEQGYAKALGSDEQLRLSTALEKACARADVIITTAKVFGGSAPRLITDAMLDGMRTGSVVIDLAVEDGGNVEGSRPDQTVVRRNGVKIIGLGRAEMAFPQTATQLLATNFYNLIDHFSGPGRGQFYWRDGDAILQSCAVSDGKTLLFPRNNR